jgi:hypothetical protein
MPGLYQGSSPKYLARIRDEQGVQLDPSDVNQVLEVRIWIYNSITGADIAKFYLNTAPDPVGSWRAASVKEVTTGDKRVLLPITVAETLAAFGNKNEIQAEVTVPDEDFDDNKRVIISKGIFPEIKAAKS